MIKEDLLEDLKKAMKEKNEIRKNTVQMVRAAILQVEKDKNIKLDDEKVLEVIAKECKKRKSKRNQNKIKSDIGNFKDTKSDSDADKRNPFSTAKGMFSQKTVDSVRN